MINPKKIFSNFSRSGSSISRIIETNMPIGYRNNLKFREDVHTIKLETTKEMEDNPNKVIASYIVDENITKGFLEAKDARVIHFINNKHKGIKTISRSYYHAIADDLAEIVMAMSINPDMELILNVSEVTEDIDRPSGDFVRFFLDCLDKEKIKYTLVDLNKFDILYINNFTVIEFPFHSGARLDLLSDFLGKHLKFPVGEPTRKVFVSRAVAGNKETSIHTENFSYPNDNRIDDHFNLESIFEELGFEIVYTEHIMDFDSQLELFMNSKVIAGLTGSGLTNAIFMKPGTTLIEVATPLITQSPLIHAEYFRYNGLDPKDFEIDLNMVQEIHTFYQNLAFFKNQIYISIPNFNRKSEDVRAFINASEQLKAFIKNV